MTQLTLDLALIPHEVENTLINQRALDGYVNATAMCQAVGKKINHYLENKTTKDFLAELSTDTGIPASELIQIVKGGDATVQGTWVHPDVAINLGQWCSPKFAVAVSKWVREWATGNIPASVKLPYHLERYMMNHGQIPHTHFSILNELTFALVAPLESQGYHLPEKMVPDISEGRMFCKWLRDEKGIDTNSLPTYKHRYQDGRVVDAKLYPNGLLADFRKHFHETWLPERAMKYFAEKDPIALTYLPRLLPVPE